jgi:low temperature requirement protein LtrA
VFGRVVKALLLLRLFARLVVRPPLSSSCLLLRTNFAFDCEDAHNSILSMMRADEKQMSLLQVQKEDVHQVDIEIEEEEEDKDEQGTKSGLHRLFAPPVLLNSWHRESRERASSGFELFVDLVMVAAASNVAEYFVDVEHQNWTGLGTFLVLFYLFVNGWSDYAHYCTRFQELSLRHSAMLFLMLLGMASMVVHVPRSGFGSEPDAFTDNASQLRGFAWSAIVLRCAIVLMYVTVAVHIPTARYFVYVRFAPLACGIVLFLISAAVDVEYTRIVSAWTWTIACIIEFTSIIFGSRFLSGHKLIPLNIEHTTDRYSCLTLVALGESVVSATIHFNQLDSARAESQTEAYYTCMGCTLLLIFTFCLMFFHLSPPRKMHAFRRSRSAGMAAFYVYKLLPGAILMLGVGFKVVIYHATSTDPSVSSRVPSFALWLLGLSLTAALVLLFCLRLLHYWGRHPRPSDPPNVRRLKFIWWYGFGAGTFIPVIVTALLDATHNTDAVLVIVLHAAIMAIVCLSEIVFADYLHPWMGDDEPELPNKSSHESTDSTAHTNTGLSQPLLDND